MKHYLSRIKVIMAMDSKNAQELAIEKLVDKLYRHFLNGDISQNEYDTIYKKLRKI